MQFHSSATAAALSGLPVASRETMDPIAGIVCFNFFSIIPLETLTVGGFSTL